MFLLTVVLFIMALYLIARYLKCRWTSEANSAGALNTVTDRLSAQCRYMYQGSDAENSDSGDVQDETRSEKGDEDGDSASDDELEQAFADKPNEDK